MKALAFMGAPRRPEIAPETLAQELLATAISIYKERWTEEKGEDDVVEPQIAIGDERFLGFVMGAGAMFFSSDEAKERLGGFVESVLTRAPFANPFVIVVVEAWVVHMSKEQVKAGVPMQQPRLSPDRLNVVQAILYTQQKVMMYQQQVESGQTIGDVRTIDGKLGGRMMPSFLDSETTRH